MSALPAVPISPNFPAQASMADALHERVQEKAVSGKRPDDPAVREFYVEVGARIRAARLAAGVLPEELALRLGVSRRSVDNYERGLPTLANITRLAEALDVDPRRLLHGSEPHIQEQLEGLQRIVLELRDRLDAPEAGRGSARAK